MQPSPIFVRIGPITVYWYGVLIVLGSLLAAQITSRLSRRNGHDPEIAWNLLIVCLVTGVIGARVYHIISSWEYYRANPGEMFSLQMSGFGIFGAVLGGSIGLWIYAKYEKLRFLEWADYIAPGLILAQAVGRWGNFFNQELYGYPTDLPWGIYIAPEHRLPGFEAFERFHPTFFYESALNFLAFLGLYYLARRWQKNRLYGDIFFLYGIFYAVIRFFTEFQRPDAWMIGGVPTAQWVSLGFILLSGSLILVRHKLRRPSMVYVPGEPWELASEEASEEVAAEEQAPADRDDASSAQLLEDPAAGQEPRDG